MVATWGRCDGLIEAGTPAKAAITWRQALIISSGLGWNEEIACENPTNRGSPTEVGIDRARYRDGPSVLEGIPCRTIPGRLRVGGGRGQDERENRRKVFDHRVQTN